MADVEGKQTRAFVINALIAKRGWWKELGLTEVQGNNYRTRFKAGSLSEEKIKELLQLAGYHIVQEELWEKIGFAVDKTVREVPTIGPDQHHQRLIDQYETDSSKYGFVVDHKE
jgi:hypothetical protein